MMEENGQDPDRDQRTWDAQMQPVYRNQRHCNETESKLWEKDFLLRLTTVDRIRPTAAAATPFNAAVTKT